MKNHRGAGWVFAGILAVAGSYTPLAMAAEGQAQDPKIQQIRNATLKITYGETTFLIDPMLSKKEAFPGFENTVHSEKRNPLIDLPFPVSEVLSGVDAVVVTHTHLDHWDKAAQKALPKDIPLFVQDDKDASTIKGQGFTNVRVLEKSLTFNGVELTRTSGQHGTDKMYASPEIAEGLGKAMGVVFQAPETKTVYLVGDTVWRTEVDRAIETYRPGIVVLNTGDAKLQNFPGSIIMGKEDVLRAVKKSPDAIVVATHMDAINHTTLSRKELREYVEVNNIKENVRIPEDGAAVDF